MLGVGHVGLFSDGKTHLWDRNQQGICFVANHTSDQHLNSWRGTVGKENVLSTPGMAVTLSDELSHFLSDVGNT